MLAVVVALGAAGVILAVPARASFHLIKITEIFPGTAAMPQAQFVELQMYSPNQTQTTGQQVIFYDETGVEQASFTFQRNLANGANQAHILAATSEAEELFGAQADLQITDELSLPGGKVCWGTPAFPVDCASWGNYGGQDAPNGGQSGTPFNQATGLVLGQSMERKITGGTEANKLDEGDDTNDSAEDFQTAQPSPQSNFVEGPSPSPSASGGTGMQDHARTITLKLTGKLNAGGRVGVKDGFAECRSQAPVLVQRKKGGVFKTIKKTRTDAQGAYDAHLPHAPGTYRAKAKPFFASDTDHCLGATSKKAEN